MFLVRLWLMLLFAGFLLSAYAGTCFAGMTGSGVDVILNNFYLIIGEVIKFIQHLVYFGFQCAGVLFCSYHFIHHPCKSIFVIPEPTNPVIPAPFRHSCTVPSFLRKQESSQAKSLYKSFQYGFLSSISFSFHARFHFLICFSRVIAAYISPCNSK